jgi:hypothetical protein
MITLALVAGDDYSTVAGPKEQERLFETRIEPGKR